MSLVGAITGAQQDGAQVDSNGFFRFPRVPAGRYTLQVRGNYCGLVRLSVDVRVGATESVEVELPCSNIPCTNPDQADPNCILKSSRQASLVGTLCEVHARPLRLGVVPIQYGLIGRNAGANGDFRQFPNARVCYSGGCVVGPQRWAEVAYCDMCRAAYYWANPMQLLWR